MTTDNVEQGDVKRDTVYSEMYCEMRYHRDYQFRSSTWFSAFLAVILGFVFVNQYDKAGASTNDHESRTLQGALTRDWCVRLWVVIASFCVAVTATLLVQFSSLRYCELRKLVDCHLEPPWKRERQWEITQPRLKSNHLLFAAPWFMLFLIYLTTVRL